MKIYVITVDAFVDSVPTYKFPWIRNAVRTSAKDLGAKAIHKRLYSDKVYTRKIVAAVCSCYHFYPCI
jgi:hypothetical protein